MSWFEKKFGKYAINNLSLVLIMCYAVGYIIQLINKGFLDYLTLNPYAVIRGQVWRLFTWIIVPPDSSNFIFVIIMLLFYYSIGTSLERTWGTYRYNVYIFSGMLFTILGSFLMMGYSYAFYAQYVQANPGYFFEIAATFFSTYYVNMSIFLAYAATFPDAQVLFMFIIPIKVKWLGIIYGVFLAIQAFTGTSYERFAIIASLLNFFIFWLRSKEIKRFAPKEIKRRQSFRQEVNRNSQITKHRCAICGRTEKDCPNMQFRFCTKCDGNFEYCEEHIYNHKHVKYNAYSAGPGTDPERSGQ
jgi:hypothetical protein